MNDFLAMGGYAQFVWSSFGLTGAVLIINIISARRRLKGALADARMQLVRAQHRSNRI